MMQIMYATDGKGPARGAGEFLTRLMDPGRAEVTILAAHDHATAEVDRYFADVLADAEKKMGEAGIVSSSMWRQGNPARCIERELWRHPYDLVAVGAGNHRWLGRLVMGSVSNHLLAHATVPVLVVHHAPAEGDRVRVLVGADGSAAVEDAIDTLTTVSSPSRLDVFVRAVIETPDLATSTWSAAPVTAPEIDRTFREARTRASAHLEEAVAGLRARGFRAEGSLGEGRPGSNLLELMTDQRVDLVVVGAHRHGAFERLVMGSVASHVARHAPAALVANAQAVIVDAEPIEEPNGHVAGNRFPVRWG